MARNNAKLNVAGASNPNWRGGMIEKACEVCLTAYRVKRANAKSRFCSRKCVGISQRGIALKAHADRQLVTKDCEFCGTPFTVYAAHAKRLVCCSRGCSNKRRAAMNAGEGNPNWGGGLSRFPYPWNFREISRKVIERDGAACQNPGCSGADARLTTHHINYEKQDCRPINLICLCSACNSKANYGREKWQVFYSAIMAAKTRVEF